MAYTNANEMIARFGELELVQLTDRDNLTGQVVLQVLDAAIADAEAEVDSYLAVRYALPLEAVPDILKSITADLARYRMHDGAMPETVQQRYTDALRFLRDVSARKASLDRYANGDTPAVANGVKVSARARVFNATEMDGY